MSKIKPTKTTSFWSKSLHQNLLYIIILCIVAICIIQFTPKIRYQPHGIYLPSTQKVYPAISPNQVQIVNSKPINAQKIGIIRVSMHFSNTQKLTLLNNEKLSLIYAKKLAAQHGANIIMGESGRTNTAGALDAQILYAYAYRTLPHSPKNYLKSK